MPWKDLFGHLDPLDIKLFKLSFGEFSWFDIDDFKNHYQSVIEDLNEVVGDEVRADMLNYLLSTRANAKLNGSCSPNLEIGDSSKLGNRWSLCLNLCANFGGKLGGGASI